MRLVVARLRSGGATPLLPPDEAAHAVLDTLQTGFLASFTRHFVEGDPVTVREQLLDVAARYGTDDLTVATNCYAFTDRVRSYQLVADAVAGIPHAS